MRIVQLTTWCNPLDMINSHYGRIPMGVWLERERDRILSSPGRRAEIKQRGTSGKMALFANDQSVEDVFWTPRILVDEDFKEKVNLRMAGMR